MSRSLHPPAAAPRRRSTTRTYLVLAIGSAAAGGHGAVRPLGTVTAPHRGLAREAARALYPLISPEELRVIAAGTASPVLLAGALAADGGLALAGG